MPISVFRQQSFKGEAVQELLFLHRLAFEKLLYLMD
jgi:hypothetical protein